jgi:chromosome segregation ATPase
VSDILTCPDEYRVALENYLEPVMNYHVVQTEAQAYEAIGLLCEAGKGKAHFLRARQAKCLRGHAARHCPRRRHGSRRGRGRI